METKDWYLNLVSYVVLTIWIFVPVRVNESTIYDSSTSTKDMEIAEIVSLKMVDKKNRHLICFVTNVVWWKFNYRYGQMVDMSIRETQRGGIRHIGKFSFQWGKLIMKKLSFNVQCRKSPILANNMTLSREKDACQMEPSNDIEKFRFLQWVCIKVSN